VVPLPAGCVGASGREPNESEWTPPAELDAVTAAVVAGAVVAGPSAAVVVPAGADATVEESIWVALADAAIVAAATVVVVATVPGAASELVVAATVESVVVVIAAGEEEDATGTPGVTVLGTLCAEEAETEKTKVSADFT
jgi:hypothetical protein